MISTYFNIFQLLHQGFETFPSFPGLEPLEPPEALEAAEAGLIGEPSYPDSNWILLVIWWDDVG